MVERHAVPNLVVLTGDVHSSWAFDLPRQITDKYDPQTGRGSLGVEIVCPGGVVADGLPGPEGRGPARRHAEVAAAPRFLDGKSRGYVVLDVTRERLQADWWFVPTVNARDQGPAVRQRPGVRGGQPASDAAPGAMAPATGPDPAPRD